MTIATGLAALLVVGLFAYLLVALFAPEHFQ